MKLIRHVLIMFRAMSPPARGAWIETMRVAMDILKSFVAPRAGGVD